MRWRIDRTESSAHVDLKNRRAWLNNTYRTLTTGVGGVDNEDTPLGYDMARSTLLAVHLRFLPRFTREAALQAWDQLLTAAVREVPAPGEGTEG